MPHLIKNESKKAGLPPGTMVYLGKNKTEKVTVELMDYTAKEFQERTIKHVEDLFPFRDTASVTWINVNGIHNTEVIEKIGKHFRIHPLVMEDIVNTNQRPKMEDFDDHIFIVLKMMAYDKEKHEIVAEQVSLILGKCFLISFQENTDGDVFDIVRQRIRSGKGRIRKFGSDYLAYSLIDAVVDHYFIILETIAEQVEGIEDQILKKPTSKILGSVHRLKRELIFLRKSVWPLREALGNLEKGSSKLIKQSTLVYLQDVHDHTMQVIDMAETLRDTFSSMMDIYLSTVSNKLNEVMKVLTIIATIFIPLTFIVGIFGMNFQYMPELHWKWSYPIVWGIMILVATGMLFYFKRRQWI